MVQNTSLTKTDSTKPSKNSETTIQTHSAKSSVSLPTPATPDPAYPTPEISGVV